MWDEGANFWVKIVGLVIVSRSDCQRPTGPGKGCQAGTENIDGAWMIRCKWARNLDRIYSIMERLNVKCFDQITSSTYQFYGWLFDQMIMGTYTV